jgi:hypothetical protein
MPIKRTFSFGIVCAFSGVEGREIESRRGKG